MKLYIASGAILENWFLNGAGLPMRLARSSERENRVVAVVDLVNVARISAASTVDAEPYGVPSPALLSEAEAYASMLEELSATDGAILSQALLKRPCPDVPWAECIHDPTTVMELMTVKQALPGKMPAGLDPLVICRAAAERTRYWPTAVDPSDAPDVLDLAGELVSALLAARAPRYFPQTMLASGDALAIGLDIAIWRTLGRIRQMLVAADPSALVRMRLQHSQMPQGWGFSLAYAMCYESAINNRGATAVTLDPVDPLPAAEPVDLSGIALPLGKLAPAGARDNNPAYVIDEELAFQFGVGPDPYVTALEGPLAHYGTLTTGGPQEPKLPQLLNLATLEGARYSRTRALIRRSGAFSVFYPITEAGLADACEHEALLGGATLTYRLFRAGENPAADPLLGTRSEAVLAVLTAPFAAEAVVSEQITGVHFYCPATGVKEWCPVTQFNPAPGYQVHQSDSTLKRDFAHF